MIHVILMALVSALVMLGGCSSEDTGCSTNSDCASGTVCANQRCVPPARFPDATTLSMDALVYPDARQDDAGVASKDATGTDDATTADASSADAGSFDADLSPDGGVPRLDADIATDAGAGDGAFADATVPDARATDGATGSMDGGSSDGGPQMSCGALTENESAAMLMANDSAATASALVGAGPFAGELQTGDDVDVYAFEATAGTTVQITVRGSNPNTIDAAFTVFAADPNEPMFRTAADPLGADAVREVFIPSTGTWHIAVTDERAAGGMAPAVVPGTFCYALELTSGPPPMPTTVQLPAQGVSTVAVHAVGASGALGFYRVEVDAPFDGEPFVVNLAATPATQVAGQQGRLPDVDTTLTIWDEARGVVLLEADDAGNTNSNALVTFTSSVANRPYWLIVDHYGLNNEDATEPLPAGGLQTDVTLEISQPTPIAALPYTDANGVLTEERTTRWYVAGQRPGVLLSAAADGTAGGLTDVSLTVGDSRFGLLDRAAPGAASAALAQVNLLGDRTLIAVDASDDLVNPGAAVTGAYTLTVDAADPCPPISGSVPASSTSLALNEILWDPAVSVADGDANGDGSRHPHHDEFIELLSTATAAVDLSGVSLADRSGATSGPRFVFPCGATLPAGRAVAVFGGGTPMGQPTSNMSLHCANDGTPRSLCLNNSTNEGVTVRGAAAADMPADTGPTLIEVEFSDFSGVMNSPDASFVRCTSASPAGPGDCDDGGVYVQHDSVPGVMRPFSPGVLVDGSVPSREGDRCEAPQVIAMSGTITQQSSVGYANDYDPEIACLGYAAAGPDRVYSILVPAGSSLAATVTPEAAYDVAVYLIAAPAANCDQVPLSCVVGADLELEGGPELVAYMNSTATDETVFIIVDGFASAGGGFELTTVVAP